MHFSIGLGAVVTFIALLELWLVYETTHLDLGSSSSTPE